MGLLLLRVTVSLIVIVQRALYFVDRDSLSLWTSGVGLMLILAGASFLIGFLTPVASGLVGIRAVSAAYSGSHPPWSLFDAPPTIVLVVIVAAALTLSGPGPCRLMRACSDAVRSSFLGISVHQDADKSDIDQPTISCTAIV
jgi:uncharacterized membrane protein YphA (DoxX/SURF4 family)